MFRALRDRIERLDALSLCRGKVDATSSSAAEREEEQTLTRRLENAVDSLDQGFDFNISRYVANWMDDAVDRYRDYDFVVTFENTDTDGYVTEKIVSAFLAQAIPIYWGTPRVKEMFNPEAFLYAGDYP